MKRKAKVVKPVKAWAVLHVEPGHDKYLIDGDDMVVRGSHDSALRDWHRWCASDGCQIIPVIIADARHWKFIPKRTTREGKR